MNLEDLGYSNNLEIRSVNLPGVYIIRFEKSDKYYIGSSGCLKNRIREHCYRLKSGTHENTYLQNSYNESSEIGFHVIITSSKQSALDEEQRLIDLFFNNGKLLNIGRCANAPQKGRPLTDAAKEKLKNANLGKKHSHETRLKQSIALKGIVRSPETRMKMSHAKSGIKLSEERKREIGNFFRGRKQKPEDVAKRANSNRGNIRPESANETVRQLHKQRLLNGSFKGSVKVSIDGVIYPAISVASKLLNISKGKIRQRMLSNNPLFKNYIKISKVT